MTRNNPNRDKVLKFINEYWAQNNNCPTVREICNNTGLKSTSTVHNIIHHLVDDGKLRSFESGHTRSCIPTGLKVSEPRFCPFCGGASLTFCGESEYSCRECTNSFLVIRKR